jgi:multidrug efflux pump
MSLSTPFIYRPVGTALLTVALGLAGGIAYRFLPTSPLPQVEFPTISVGAGLPGASPETMASAVATPLERQFGRIAAVTEMTSTSSLGSSSITLQFDLNRSIDAAARDVQAAINAARGQLPANLPNNPTYRKINPADAPILILSLTSDLVGKGRMYDVASSILAQKLAQVQGVGQVFVGGSSLPAVRVELNPTMLNSFGLNIEDVHTALTAMNANRPKGEFMGKREALSLYTTDQLFQASEYQPLVVSYSSKNGGAIRLSDIANVTDSVEDIRTGGSVDGKPSIVLVIFRQPGANIIDTVDRVRGLLPAFQAQIPPTIHLGVALDRTTTIRASVHDVQISLMISVCLVILVVFIFLRSFRSTLIPGVAVPISLIGTFGVMYLCNYSLDNLSLMALTIATGFVVDDAIVVIENITRHLEGGMKPFPAALLGAKEIGFTVLSMSTSLVAVFIPILLMGGIVGRLFREFAVVLSTAIGVSLLVSLTTTPMMCAHLLKEKRPDDRHNWLFRMSESVFNGTLAAYSRGLTWVLRHQPLTLAVAIGTVALSVYLYITIPKGFFPQQDVGRLNGMVIADQSISFQSMDQKMQQIISIVLKDPDVEGATTFYGGQGTTNNGRMFVTLKPLGQRKTDIDHVIGRLRPKLGRVPGATLFLQAVQDVRIGGRMGGAQYQYTLQGDDFSELVKWAPQVTAKLKTLYGLADVNSDQQDKGLQASLLIDRNSAARLGITAKQIDATLYDAFGQSQVSTMYTQINQYHVVMNIMSDFWQNPDGLQQIYLTTNRGTQAPLSAFTHYAPSTTPLSINHSGQFPSVTISFNLVPGFPLGTAVDEIDDAQHDMGLPAAIHGSFSGAAQAYQASLANEPILILAALIAVYIVLGILYESFIHPVTILSTLPSAGVGALLALKFTNTDLSVIALIGIILLIGIVKKNAIMMIDFALEAERNDGKSPEASIYQACVLRFRPITMTTMAALLGGLPLALGLGNGAELRRPLGITIVGGLLFSQMLTLFTTPVVYLYMDRFRLWATGAKRRAPGASGTPEVAQA